MSEPSEIKTGDLAFRYIDILSKHGRDSQEAIAFRYANELNNPFVQLVQMVHQTSMLLQATGTRKYDFVLSALTELIATLVTVDEYRESPQDVQENALLSAEAAIGSVLTAVKAKKPLDQAFIEEASSFVRRKTKWVKAYEDIPENEKDKHRIFVHYALKVQRHLIEPSGAQI